MNKRINITGPEKRSFKVSVRAESQGDEMTLVGRAASFNKLSSDLGGFREMLAVGCFDQSLAAPDDIKCLAGHDPNRVLGTRDSGTLSLSCDSAGLNFRCRLNPAIQFHRDVYEVVKSGLADQCSFAFSVVPPDGDDWNEVEENGVKFVKRTVRNVKLFEVSCAVTFPAYPGDATNTDARAKAKANANRDQRIAAAGASVDADKRAQRIADAGAAVSGADVSGMEDFMAARDYVAHKLRSHMAGMAVPHRYITHTQEPDQVLGLPENCFDEDPDESDEDCIKRAARWYQYGISKTGEVELKSWQRYDPAKNPEGPDSDVEACARPMLSELREAAILKRRMRASAGIFYRR